MRLIIGLCLLFGVSHIIAQTSIALEDLNGRWYIHQSNFPMWLNGKKTQPTFNYSIADKGKLFDQVIFQKKGKQKSIVGYDKPINDSNTVFVWRGKGLMALLKSKWEILHLDKTNEWALIYFEKTLFTPAGYDVISRQRTIKSSTEKLILEQLKQLNIDATLSVIPQS